MSFMVASFVHQSQVANIKQNFEMLAHDYAQSIKNHIADGLMIGYSLAGLFEASEFVSEAEFSQFSKVLISNYDFFQALEWSPRVNHSTRSSYELIMQEKYPGFQFTERTPEGSLIKAKIREQYAPIYYVEPYESNKAAHGFDLASNESRKKALDYAQDFKMPSTTQRIKLVQSDGDQYGFIMFIPVYNNKKPTETIEQRRQNLDGFVTIVFNIPLLVESALKYFSSDSLQFAIYDVTDVIAGEVLFQHQQKVNLETISVSSEFQFSNKFIVNNREWRIDIRSAPDYFDTSISFQVKMIFFGILLSSLFATAYLQLLFNSQRQLQRERDLLESEVKERTRNLLEKNRELEAYSYSIAHDLRAPLRTITSFSQIVQEEAVERLNDDDKANLQRVVTSAKYLSNLINDILEISRVARSTLEKRTVNLSELAQHIAERLSISHPERQVKWLVQANLTGQADESLIKIILENLLGNAFKFTNKIEEAVIEFGGFMENGQQVYYVRDNGIGFDMQYIDKLFGLFQRLNPREEYEGTGIGLATVKRIIKRHNGKVWAKSRINKGTTFYFTLE